MSAPPMIIPIPPNIAASTAPLVLGEIFSGYLFGVLSVQLYLYYLTFPNDSRYIKALVYIVFCMEFASSLMCLFDVYHWFAKGFGSMLALNDVNLSAIDGPMLGAFVAAGVQMFYCYRIYMINKKAWMISVVVGLLSLAQIAGGIYGAVVAEQAKFFSVSAHRALHAAYIVFIGAAVADVVIATTMITLLLGSHQRSAPHPSSSSAINKIINLIVETNLASASIALLTVILLVACPNTNYFTCPSLILGRIYSNSLLLILNNRHYLRTGRETEFSAAPLHKMSRLPASSGGYTSSSNSYPKDSTIRVEVDTATDHTSTFTNDIKRSEIQPFARV